MNKFILLAVMSFLLICQDFPHKEFVDESVKIALKGKKAVEKKQTLITETIFYSKKCLNAK